MDEEDAFAPSLPFPPIDTSAAAANKNEGGGGGTQGFLRKVAPTDVCTCSGPCLCAPPPPLAASLAAAAVRIWGLEKGRRQEQEEKGLKKMRDTMSKKWGALFRPTYCPSRPPRVEPGSSGSSGASRRRPIVHLARRDPEERGVFQERRDVYLLSCRRLFFRVTRAAELNVGKAGEMCPERKATTRIATDFTCNVDFMANFSKSSSTKPFK